MEFLLGSLVTALTGYFVAKSLLSAPNPMPPKFRPYTQSYIYRIAGPMVYEQEPIFNNTSKQSFAWQSRYSLRIFVMSDTAYWIADEKVYMAKIGEDGTVPPEGKVVDMMGMDKVQLDKMIYIVDKLTEGNSNDIGNSRNS